MAIVRGEGRHGNKQQLIARLVRFSGILRAFSVTLGDVSLILGLILSEFGLILWLIFGAQNRRQLAFKPKIEVREVREHLYAQYLAVRQP